MDDAGRETTAEAPERILLVPGFMSPRWLLVPLSRYLRRNHSGVELWDYPKVFNDLRVTIDALAKKLKSDTDAGLRITVIAHSFGDWVTRSALVTSDGLCVTKLVSITPVARAVPLAGLAHLLTRNWIPEIAVMADQEQAAFALDVNPAIEHIVIWASWDLMVKRPKEWPNSLTKHQTVWGNHITVALQPNLWRAVASHLS